MIKFKDRIIGLTQGLYLWAAIGGVSLGLYSDNGEGGGALGFFYGVSVGGILGGVSGFIIGGSHQFKFKEVDKK